MDRQELFWAIVDARVRFGGLISEPSRYWREPDIWAKRYWYRAEMLDHPA